MLLWFEPVGPVISCAVRAPGDDAQLRWEVCGVHLDRAPCSAGEAGEPAPRANPDHGIESM